MSTLVGGQKISEIEDTHKSIPLVYLLPSDAADAINSVPRDAAVQKVCIFCDEINSWSQQGATRHHAAVSNTATDMQLAMSVMCEPRPCQWSAWR